MFVLVKNVSFSCGGGRSVLSRAAFAFLLHFLRIIIAQNVYNRVR